MYIANKIKEVKLDLKAKNLLISVLKENMNMTVCGDLGKFIL
jgi:hypothetical protein